MTHQSIAVLDFGGQYAHLIANRVRRLGVYSEILDAEVSVDELKGYKGIILSGGPQSVYDEASPKCDPKLFELGVPVLGICYGHQLMQHILGGKVISGKTKEYGMAELNILKNDGLFTGVPEKMRAWMSHFDLVGDVAPGFEIMASTVDCPTAAVANLEKNYYGIQFHTEVTHTENGNDILKNFLLACQVEMDWNLSVFMEEEIARIQEKIGDKKVFLLVSGGVDSTVCFALLEKALGQDRVYGMLVDHGMMRFEEASRVKKALNDAGFHNLHVAEKQELFLGALKGLSEPEAKRKIIGELFWKVKEDEAERLELNPDEWIMGQGTIYPDTIETGGTKRAHKIKTHHNRVDLVQEMIDAGKVIEPIAQLYKDEVRDLGERLGLPHNLVWRHPFPGPGLGVRLLCASSEDVSAAEETRASFQELNGKITQFIQNELGLSDAKAIVLPAKSVGVQGDERTYRHPLALFTTNRDWNKLEEISTAITNHFHEVNRVILTLKGEPGDFDLQALDTSNDRISLLQKVDQTVNDHMQEAPEDYGIWQFPVVLLPTGTAQKQSIVLRPIVSTDAMTASFAHIDWDVLDALMKKIDHAKLSHVFYDLTHKPPGTIEWE